MLICLFTDKQNNYTHLLNSVLVHFCIAIQQWFGVAWIRQVIARFPEVCGSRCICIRHAITLNFGPVVCGRSPWAPYMFYLVANTSTRVHYHAPRAAAARFLPRVTRSNSAERCTKGYSKIRAELHCKSSVRLQLIVLYTKWEKIPSCTFFNEAWTSNTFRQSEILMSFDHFP